MSGDQTNSSFGDPNAQPPTPKQTPTPVSFPSPLFETPKNNRASLDEQSGWTPRFAEEYSVFNSTPDNLRESQGPFTDFSISTSYQPACNHKRPVSAENFAAEIATHVNHFSPNLNLPLPPVDPSRRLASSPRPLTGKSHSTLEADPPSDSQQRFVKKVRRGTLEEDDQAQTITPPPSARKGRRKLAPKLQTDMMQNDQVYGQEFVAGMQQQQHQQQQHNMPHLMTTSSDMFGYTISATATAPVYGDPRAFWDTDPNLGGMEMDFSAGANVFQTTNHRPINSMDWGRSHEMFQETGVVPMPIQDNAQPRKERALAPKPALPSLETNGLEALMFGNSFPVAVDDPFGMVQTGGVNPGLLFSRPPSTNMELATFDPMAEASLTHSMPQAEPMLFPQQSTKSELRRSASTRESGTKKFDSISSSSPIEPSEQPDLARKMSENRGRKPMYRCSILPTLAPAGRPIAQQTNTRSVSQSSLRANGRASPLKSHHRLSSLSSIPESAGPKIRTSVKFTIDSRGRARAETTTVMADDDYEPTPTAARRRKVFKERSKDWRSSDGDGSSTDDEPIIIPSRNTSFALPDPRKPTSLCHPNFHLSQRSMSEHSASSLGIFYNEANPNDAESEAETVLNEPGPRRGDAASELRKMKASRQKQISFNTSQRFVSGPTYSSSPTISPTTLTENSLLTPSSSRGNIIRCVCNNNEDPANSDGFMVQCESCENWLHGSCINITSRRSLPCVYICAFCANTPRPMRDAGMEMLRRSPLANKSFKSFR